jgi:two-component system sensor histidine kinase DctS
MSTPQPLALDALGRDSRQAAALTRRALAWMAALLLLVAVSAVLMLLFLRQEEARESDRRRAADAEWLDQTLRFHLRRLEADLATLGRDPAKTPPHGGPWWRNQGLVAHHAWVPAQATHGLGDEVSTLLDTTRGLQRPAYAGPLPASDGGGPWLWLAVPRFEQGHFTGDAVAAVRLQVVIDTLIPAWFLQDHTVSLAPPTELGDGEGQGSFLAPINLPGAQLRLRVAVLGDPWPLAPRAFFAVALLCLAGMLLALLLLWRDTQRRQRAEASLQAQLALRSAMERSVSLGLLAWDGAGRLLYANPAFGRLVGWAPDALIAAPTPSPYWPEDQGAEFDRVRQAASDPALQQAGLALRLRQHGGQPLDVLLHSAPLALADGEVTGWVATVLDLSERLRVERLAARQQEQLEASARLVAVGEVASTLAHELNQPLGALSSFATGLLNRLGDGSIEREDIVPVVQRMARMADKAGRVIQRVNAFARRQEMSPQPLALAPFVARVAQAVPLPEGVSLELDLPGGDGPTVPADALLLEHALHNLVLNAGEWAERGTARPARVRVDLVAEGAQVGVRVADTGPGVAPEHLAGIFDAFASHKPGGMGMGLAICRSIVEAHHGRIVVDRSPELLGAQFTLCLPTMP